MLLLVLILVVIAFGLLVVALLSTSVLWAWVSVGVSVVAAVVLLVDWLQRRAAAKAGAMPALEPAAGSAPMAAPGSGSARPAMAAPPRADLDPATEVLPIVPSSARGGSEPDSPTVMAAAPQQFDAQQTVVMPAVQPSGSPVRPSGADPAVTSSGTISSPNVTNGEADRSVSGFGTGDEKSSVEPPAVSGSALSSVEAGTSDAPSDPGATGVTSDAPDAGVDGTPSSETPGQVGLGKAGFGAGAAAGGLAATAATSLTKSDTPPAVPEKSPDVSSPTQAAEEVAAPEPAAGAADPDVESTVAVEAHAPAEAAASAPAADAARVDTTLDDAAAAPAEQVDLFAAAPASAPVEAVSSAEAPEEPRDPAAAEIVSGLDDEVVVVDEQPRYHVSECRALASVTVIPLPVREAVELGFTPCGWCSPDRTLAGRHQTASR